MKSKEKVFTNLIWRLSERIGVQGVSFIVSIVLARIVAPEAYGTISLITVFITILQVFIDSGMGNALIQKKNADKKDFSTVFYFNIAMCVTLYAILFLCAPLIAKFYNNPELSPVVRVLGIVLLLSGVKNIQASYVSRNLMFKKFFFSTLGATIFSAIVGIAMAYKGYGVWALVGQQLTNTFVSTVILFFIVKWRPTLEFSLTRLKSLFNYGWKLLVSALIDTVYTDIRTLIIGKMYSPSDLAFYNKGEQIPQLITKTINSSIDSVLLPTMSREQDKTENVKSMTRRAIRTSTYFMAPLMIGIAVCSEPLVRLLLTDTWIECVPFLRIYCITYIFRPIHTANLNAIKAMGRSEVFLKLEIIKKVAGMALLFSSVFISVKAIAYSLLISTLLSTVINSYPNKKFLNYNWSEQMKDIIPYLALSALMAIPVFLISYLPIPTIAILILQVLTGVIFYIGVSALLKLETFYYLFNLIKGFLKKGKSK